MLGVAMGWGGAGGLYLHLVWFCLISSPLIGPTKPCVHYVKLYFLLICPITIIIFLIKPCFD